MGADKEDDLADYEDTPEEQMSSFGSPGERQGLGFVRTALLAGVFVSAVGLVIGYAAGFGKGVWLLALIAWGLATLVWLVDSYQAGTRAGRERPLAVPLGATLVASLAMLLLTFVAFAGDGGGNGTPTAVGGRDAPTDEATGTPDENATGEPSGTKTPDGTRTVRPTATRDTPTPGGGTRDPNAETYVVQPGDTLSGIASQFNTTIEAIKEANDLTSDNIIVGQELIIP